MAWISRTMSEIHALLVRVVGDFFDFRPRTAMASALLKGERQTNPVRDHQPSLAIRE